MRNLSQEIAARGTARVQLVAACICGVIIVTLLGAWIFLLVCHDPYSRDLLPIITMAARLVAGIARGKSLR